MKIFVNNRIVDEKKASISIFDRGFLYGDGIFETMRSYNGRVLALDRHLDRLYSSAKVIDLKIKLGRESIKKQIYKLIRINGLKDAYIRLAATRGEGRVGLNAVTAKSSSVVIIVKHFTPYPAAFYEKGISLYTSSVRRNAESPLSSIKSLNYLNNILARMDAQKRGADDALLLNTKGFVAESAVSNIFMIKRKGLITPSLNSGILPGVTREIVLSIAKKAGLKAIERKVSPRELKGADEVFLTNTLMEVMPVVKIDKTGIGKRRPGLLTKFIHLLYSRQI
ncbi:MAG: branched-chain-amino-acid transaminase [Candidatus Omnitrophica bacterium]|nr:branched-chain-amino-acid transaminase [Candidatus Omnitrophota bacterium]